MQSSCQCLSMDSLLRKMRTRQQDERGREEAVYMKIQRGGVGGGWGVGFDHKSDGSKTRMETSRRK